MVSSKLRNSSSFPNILLSCLNFLLFLLSATSLAPIIVLKMPPTSLGWAFLMISSMSLFSSFIGFYSQLTQFCFITHISLLIVSSIGQLLGILALFTKEKPSLSLLKSPRDPREAKVLVRLECGILMAMFVMQVGVLVMTCAVHSCWVREYKGLEMEREAMARKRSRRIARAEEESMVNAVKMAEMKAKEMDDKMKNMYGQGTGKKEELILEHQKPAIPQFERVSHSSLHFNQLQPLDQELVQENTIEFGQFVARKAMLDEEYWTAAWLRAESHWENQTNERYVNNYKRKFAEQEFNALKRRCRNLHKHKCTCIVTMRKENKNVKRTVLKSILGTLDLSIGHLLPGETFSGERVQAPPFCSIDRTSQNRYGYIANLCVAKSARCQGIATNMMYFAVQLAKSGGVEHVFVHVHKDNIPAKKLYQKMGFELVDVATLQLSKEKTLLLRITS
ncbi:Peptide alpha-N-acetyltransferase [Bertholletia excelsa]